MGFSETPALNSSRFPVNYRCFTLALVKLGERRKLWPQFVKEGRVRGYALEQSLDIASSRWMCRLCAISPEHFIISIIYQEGSYCFPKLLVCVCCAPAGTILECVPCLLRKVRGSQGHGVAGSAPCREETGLSLRKAGNFLF